MQPSHTDNYRCRSSPAESSSLVSTASLPLDASPSARDDMQQTRANYDARQVTHLFETATQQHTDPPNVGTRTIYQQMPRFEGDLYTARWIRGEGADRAGWCGFCRTWLNMKDSTYVSYTTTSLYYKLTNDIVQWYHMHNTHGISYSTGRHLAPPVATRSTSSSWQVLCGGCDQWLCLTNKDAHRARTTYFRHAYKCHTRVQTRSEQ